MAITLVMIGLLIFTGCASEPNAIAKKAKENNDPDNLQIISTTVALTEIMDALDVDLIGVPSSYKELPARYEGLPEIGSPMSPDMELIMSLQPKEVLSVTSLKFEVEETFADAGIETNYANLESIDNMKTEILKLGEKYDRTEKAEEIAEQFDDKIAEIAEKTAEKNKPKVLILLGVPGSYLVGTDQSYLGDLVEKAGGENVFSNEKVEFLSSNTEHLQQSAPDIILRAAHGMPDEVVKMFDKEFKENDIWKHFTAVENGQVFDLEETLFGTAGNLKAPDALDELYKMLYSGQ
jgi:iron complex transport system substrate-binding protein